MEYPLFYLDNTVIKMFDFEVIEESCKKNFISKDIFDLYEITY